VVDVAYVKELGLNACTAVLVACSVALVICRSDREICRELAGGADMVRVSAFNTPISVWVGVTEVMVCKRRWKRMCKIKRHKTYIVGEW
jgi:hypothetical protein